jgi:hypothetical protein
MHGRACVERLKQVDWDGTSCTVPPYLHVPSFLPLPLPRACRPSLPRRYYLQEEARNGTNTREKLTCRWFGGLVLFLASRGGPQGRESIKPAIP